MSNTTASSPDGSDSPGAVAAADAGVSVSAPGPSAGVAGGPTAPGGDTTHPLVDMIKIAAPTVATMSSYTLMQFIDGLMVSRIGPEPVYVAARGNGGMAAWIPIAVVMGLLTVVNTYVSQNLGAGRPQRGSVYGWTAVWISLVVWAVLMLPYAFVLPWIFAQLGHEPEVLRLEVEYGQVLVLGSFFTMGARGISHYFYGMHRPMTVLGAVILGNLVNVFLNWVLIYGNLGAPPLGMRGAAIATVIGGAVEFLIPLAVFLSGPYHARYATRAAWRPSARALRDVLSLGWPGALMFGNEMFCWGYFMIYLVGEFGPTHNSAGWIAMNYMHLSFMPAVGISIAVTAMVGRCMGMRRPDLAAKRALLGVKLNMTYMGLCALGFVVFREPAVRAFIPEGTSPEDTAELLRIGRMVMVAGAVFQVFDALGITLVGALRGAGDTVWPGVVTLLLAWSCIIAGGHALVAWAPGLESLGPWIGASAYIILLGLAMSARFALGRWKRIDVLRGSSMPGH